MFYTIIVLIVLRDDVETLRHSLTQHAYECDQIPLVLKTILKPLEIVRKNIYLFLLILI